jgi:Protein of unknown function (DUF2889)
MIDSPFLRQRAHYERVMDGRVDNTHPDAFTHTVRLRDDDLDLELSAVATASPDYEIRTAGCRVLAGAADPQLAGALDGLAGVRMVSGFTRRVAEVVRDRAGSHLVVDAAVEIARLARQVGKLPPERAARAAGGDAWECWQLDMAGWVDLPDSCFTYSDAGRAVFGTRPVRSAMSHEFYAPPAGKLGVFTRKKIARLERLDARLRLFHSMEDPVHHFEISYEIDLAGARIVEAASRTPRLPYRGICDEPQGRIAGLIGQPVDADLRRRMQDLIGGSRGCAQLYDLTADLLKLIRIT